MVVERARRPRAKTQFEVVRTGAAILSVAVQLVVLGKVMGWF